jgi:hypothetical protein
MMGNNEKLADRLRSSGFSNAVFNLNFTISSKPPSYALMALDEGIDFVYCNILKPPLGDEYLPEEATFQFRTIKMFESNYSSEIKAGKIILDGCYLDSLPNASGCGANINKVVVWPDGSVSGCPYALKPQTGPASTSDGVVANIRKALSRSGTQWSFNACKLPLAINDSELK